MKKLLIGTNILLLSVIAIQVWNQKDGSVSAAKSSLISAQDPCLSKLCSTFRPNARTNLISYQLASEMSHAYNSSQGKNLVWNGSRMSNVEDASSVVFDLQTMKNYIAYIETNVCKNCTEKSVQLGIRFYYAQYPGGKAMSLNPQLSMLDRNYADKHTLFMVPVYRFPFEKGIYINFDPQSVRNCNFRLDTSSVVPSPLWIALAGDDTPEDNHGSLRPPPAGTGVFPEN